ncbi:hypothetical protein IN07_03370 [Modestobacter caceresii]|uniref:Uncharacterized protein n=1 Tax=Modestobacter caceresii TaxID=1522368 RepID=A0A098YCV8_9ACTN|nr:hypothetical protein [Modestobacter caceresii]KGH48255.1 hypothetical protein IN07_03370 [Modestobacter caceresii]
MPHSLGHHGHVDAAGEHQRRGAVPQVVETNLPQPGCLSEPLEGLGDLPRGQVGAVLPGEHPAAVGVATPPLQALGVLREPVGHQGADGALPDVDPTVLTGAGLGLALHDLAADLDELRTDGDEAALEVDVGPTQRTGLPAAQAGERHDLVQAA